MGMMEHETTPPPALLRHPTYLMSKAVVIGRRIVGETLEESGLHLRHFSVLTCLQAYGPECQRDVAARLGLDASDVVPIVDELESQGLVERHRDPDDRRRYSVTLTEHGRSIVAEASAAADEAQREFLAVLDDAERRRLTDMLLRVLASHDDRYRGA